MSDITPAGKAAVAKATKTQTKFIDILKTDHKFDIIKKVLDHIGMIDRAKKISPLDKHKLLQTYYLTLLTYCLPKMKLVEDNTDKNSKPMNFQINIGTPAPTPAPGKPGRPKKSQGGVSITIPTRKASDGSYSIDNNYDED